MRRFGAVLLFLCITAAPVVHGEAAVTAKEFQGRFACRIVGPVDPVDCPSTGAPDRTRLDWSAAGNLTALVIEARWNAAPAGDVRFRVAIDPPIDRQQTRFFIVRSGTPLQIMDLGAGAIGSAWTLRVEPHSQDGIPVAVWEQQFRLAVSSFQDGALPRPSYSVFDGRPDFTVPAGPAASDPVVFATAPTSARDPAPLLFTALVGGGLAGLALGWPRLRASFVVALLSRLSRRQVVEHPRRKAILEVVREQPGIGAAELRRRLEVPRTSFDYHVRVLAGAHVVSIVGQRGRPHLWVRGTETPPATPPTAAAVLEFLQSNPGAPVRALASQLRISKRLVRYHLHRLERAGQARRDGLRRSASWFPGVAAPVPHE